MNTLKARLKYYRNLIGISQLELSQKSNVSQASIARIESGIQKNLKRETIEKLAEGLGISITELMESPDIVKEEGVAYSYSRDLPVITLKGWRSIKNLDKLSSKAKKSEPAFSDDSNAFYLLVSAELINHPVIDEGDMILIEPSVNVKEKDLVLYQSPGSIGIGNVYYRQNIIIIVPLDKQLFPLLFKRADRRKGIVKIFRISGIMK